MKHSIPLTLCAVLGLALNVHSADKATLEAHAASYHRAGKSVVEMALTKKVDAAEVEKKVQTMVADALWFVGEYSKAFPKGEKLLKVITDNADAMKKLSFKDLEHEWHDLGHFEKADKDIGLDLKAEENEHFTDPIHSLVHPLLVLKAAQDYASSKSDAALKSIKEEMEEGLEQMEKQKAALLKK
jgi:hypothetical protein